MGMVYKRGNVWWVKYYVNGRPVRESTGTDMVLEAKKMLKERDGKAVTGQPIIKRADRIRYEEIAEVISRAAQRYAGEVRGRTFPGVEQTYQPK